MLRWSRDKDREKAGHGPAADSGTASFRTHARPVRPLEQPRAVRDAVAPGEGTATLEGILLAEGTVTAEELKAAQDVQAKEGGFLGQILIDLGYIDANSLTSFLAKHCKIPHLSLLDYLIDEAQVKLVPQEICLKYRLLPIDRLGKNLTVAMVNPLDTQALEEVRRACPELRVKPILCEYSHFESVARRLFKIEQVQREVSMDTLGLATPSAKTLHVEAPPAQPTPPPATTAPTHPKHEPAQAAEPASPPPPPSDLEPLGEEAPTPATPTETPPPLPEPPAKPHAETPPPADEPHDETSVVTKAPKEPHPVEALPSDRSFDDEAVLEAFFGVVGKDDEEDDEPADRGAQSGAPSVLQEMVAIMGDSMRDTYGMLARKLALFTGLSSEQVAKIFAKGITAEFEDGQTVFNEGEKGEDLYVILGGSVAIIHNGTEIARLTAGDAFGETALFTKEPRNASAVAIETSSFLVLNETVIRRVLDKDTVLQLLGNLVVSLSRRLQLVSRSHS